MITWVRTSQMISLAPDQHFFGMLCSALSDQITLAMQIPTQKFFTETFGLPLTMKPNFEDLSCEMIFGEAPPPIHLDEVYNEPCFTKNCVLADRNPNLPCPKVDTNRKQTLKAAGMLWQWLLLAFCFLCQVHLWEEACAFARVWCSFCLFRC